MPKNRIRRKDLKRPDEFVTLTTRAIRWCQANARVAVLAVIGIAVVLVGLAITSAYRSARQRNANADLSRALLAMRADDLSRAAQEFTDAANRWSPSLPGQLASVLAANTVLRQGNAESAVAAIERVAATSGDLPVYLQQQVQFVWAVALESGSKWKEAADKYAAAAAMSGPYRGPAILGEARSRELAGDSQRARELYQAYVEEFSDMPDSEIVRAKAKS